MRLSLLSASLPLLLAVPAAAQAKVSDELRDEIRRIIREEIRAAMKEHHAELAKAAHSAAGEKAEKKVTKAHGFELFADHPLEFSTSPMTKTSAKAFRMIDGGKFEEVDLDDLKKQMKEVNIEFAKKVEGTKPMMLEVKEGKPVKVEVKQGKQVKVEAKKPGVMVLHGEHDGKVIHVAPAGGTECQIECVVVDEKGARQALAECCKALEAAEECCEAVKAATEECCEGGEGVECVDEVAEEAKPAKAAKKAKSKDKKKSKKAKAEKSEKAGAESKPEGAIELKISEVLEKLAR